MSLKNRHFFPNWKKREKQKNDLQDVLTYISASFELSGGIHPNLESYNSYLWDWPIFFVELSTVFLQLQHKGALSRWKKGQFSDKKKRRFSVVHGSDLLAPLSIDLDVPWHKKSDLCYFVFWRKSVLKVPSLDFWASFWLFCALFTHTSDSSGLLTSVSDLKVLAIQLPLSYTKLVELILGRLYTKR